MNIIKEREGERARDRERKKERERDRERVLFDCTIVGICKNYWNRKWSINEIACVGVGFYAVGGWSNTDRLRANRAHRINSKRGMFYIYIF